MMMYTEETGEGRKEQPQRWWWWLVVGDGLLVSGTD